MGMFDDLIPRQAKPSGMFDDLIPARQAAPQTAPQPVGTPNLTPAPPIAGAGPNGSDLNWNDPGYREALTPRPKPEGPRPWSDKRIFPGIPSGREFQLAAQAVGRGVAETPIVPLPVPPYFAPGPGAADIFQGLYNTVAPNFGLEPTGYTSEAIRGLAGEGMRAVGAAPIEEQDMSPAEKGAYTTGRFAADAATGGKALAAKAAKSVPSAFPSRWDAFLEPYRQNAARALKTDVAAGAGSGATLSLYDEYMPEEMKGPLGSLMATLTGGLGGATTLNAARAGVKGTVQGAKDAAEGAKYDPAIPKDAFDVPTTRRTARDAAAHLQASASDPAAAAQNISKNQDFYASQGLPEPSLGPLSGDTGLVGIDRTARMADSAPFIERDAAVRTGQTRKLSSMAEDVPPSDRRAVQEFAGSEATRMQSDAQAQRSEIQGNLAQVDDAIEQSKQQAADIVAPVRARIGSEGESSLKVKQQVTEARKAAKEGVKAAYNEVDRSTPAVFDATVDAARAAAKEMGDTGVVPPVVKRILRARGSTEDAAMFADDPDVAAMRGKWGLDAVEDADGSKTFGELEKDLKNVNAAIEEAEISGSNRIAHTLGIVRDGINEDLDTLGKSSEPLRAANTKFKTEYAPKYKEGPTKDVLRKGAVPDSKTLNKYLTNSEGVAQLRSITGDNAETVGAVKNHLMARMAVNMDADTTPKYVRSFIDKNAHLWGTYPEIKKDLEAFYKDILNNRVSRDDLKVWSQELGRDLKYANKNAADVEATVNRGILRTFLANEPENAVAKIFGAGDPEVQMRDAMDLVAKDKTGRAGKAFKASVRDFLVNKFTGARTENTVDESFSVVQGRVEAFLKRPGVEAAIDTLYKSDPEALEAMRTARKVGRGMAKLNQQSVAGSAAAENAAAREKWMQPLEAVLKAKWGILKGGGIVRTVRIWMNVIPGLNNDAAITALMSRAALDGDIAKHLLGMDAVKMPQKTWVPKLNQLMGAGEAGRRVDTEPPEEDQKQ